MKNLLIISLLFIAIFFFSCDRVVEDFGKMGKLRDSILKVFPDENVNIKISNGYYISVGFVNSRLKELRKEKKQEIALKVGQITRAFFDKQTIREGVLVYAIYKNYLVFKYSESIDTYKLFLEEPIQDSIEEQDKNQSITESAINIEPEAINHSKEIAHKDSDTYRVQIMATNEPIKNRNKQFKGLNYKVDEIYIAILKNYRYKYTIGKECNMEKAKALLKELNNSGFPDAFIIKTDAELISNAN